MLLLAVGTIAIIIAIVKELIQESEEKEQYFKSMLNK